jgi:hypothetical protein
MYGRNQKDNGNFALRVSKDVTRNLRVAEFLLGIVLRDLNTNRCNILFVSYWNSLPIQAWW